MSEAGFVYILINTSMPDLVKIGKTTRSPTGRAHELSGATGVPTPFLLVYDSFFADCSAAEEFIHVALESQGYRVSQSREFFNVAIKDAVDAVLAAKNHFSQSGTHEQLEATSSNETSVNCNAAAIPIEHATRLRAENALVRDKKKVIAYYRQAISLGSASACFDLGTFYLEDCGPNSIVRAATVSSEANIREALEVFKEGARKGSIECFGAMTIPLVKLELQQDAVKAWERCFSSTEFRKSTQVGFLGTTFIRQVRRQDILMDISQPELKSVRDQILLYVENEIQSASTEILKAESLCIRNVALFNLYPEQPFPPKDCSFLKGVISEYNNESKDGVINQEDKSQVIFNAKALLRPNILGKGVNVLTFSHPFQSSIPSMKVKVALNVLAV